MHVRLKGTGGWYLCEQTLLWTAREGFRGQRPEGYITSTHPAIRFREPRDHPAQPIVCSSFDDTNHLAILSGPSSPGYRANTCLFSDFAVERRLRIRAAVHVNDTYLITSSIISSNPMLASVPSFLDHGGCINFSRLSLLSCWLCVLNKAVPPSGIPLGSHDPI